MHDTAALEGLYEQLPPWCIGAEWAKFTSMVVSTEV